MDLYFVLFTSTDMLVSFEHEENALQPILVTLFGIAILVKLEQPQNALWPILVTLFGIVILVRLEQSQNALLPILVTLFGIVILVRFRHDSNALSPILVTGKPLCVPITTFVSIQYPLFLRNNACIAPISTAPIPTRNWFARCAPATI